MVESTVPHAYIGKVKNSSQNINIAQRKQNSQVTMNSEKRQTHDESNKTNLKTKSQDSSIQIDLDDQLKFIAIKTHVKDFQKYHPPLQNILTTDNFVSLPYEENKIQKNGQNNQKYNLLIETDFKNSRNMKKNENSVKNVNNAHKLDDFFQKHTDRQIDDSMDVSLNQAKSPQLSQLQTIKISRKGSLYSRKNQVEGSPDIILKKLFELNQSKSKDLHLSNQSKEKDKSTETKFIRKETKQQSHFKIFENKSKLKINPKKFSKDDYKDSQYFDQAMNLSSKNQNLSQLSISELNLEKYSKNIKIQSMNKIKEKFMFNQLNQDSSASRSQTSNYIHSGRKNNTALISQISQQTHARQETVQLKEDKKFPTKSIKVNEYSTIKKSKFNIIKMREEEENEANADAEDVCLNFSNNNFIHLQFTQNNFIKMNGPSSIQKQKESSELNFSQTDKNQQQWKYFELNSNMRSKMSLRMQNLKFLSPKALIQKSNLTHIDLRNNRLNRLPEEICDLVLLKEIKIDYNFLNSFPSGLHRLQNLVFFSASHNQIKKIPSSLMIQNSKLEFLHLNDNKISKISQNIGFLQQLQSLVLNNNRIVEIPISFGNLNTGKLKEFELDWFIYVNKKQLIKKNSNFKNRNTYNQSPDITQNDNQILYNASKRDKSEPPGGSIQINQNLNYFKNLKSDQSSHSKQIYQTSGHQYKEKNFTSIIDNFIIFCRYIQVINVMEKIKELKVSNQSNPQQDDFEEDQLQFTMPQLLPAEDTAFYAAKLQINSSNKQALLKSKKNLESKLIPIEIKKIEKQSYYQNKNNNIQMQNMDSLIVSYEKLPGIPKQSQQLAQLLTQRKNNNQSKKYDKREKQKQKKSESKENVSFIQFFMYFQNIKKISQILYQNVIQQKQRKLSHLLSLYGHSYLMKEMINKLQNIEYINSLKLQESIIDQTVDQETNLQNEIQIVNHFINSFDFDQTTPLIFALKNQRKNIIRLLLENQQTCLTTRNLRYGSPLHVALNNLDFKSAIIILNNIIKNQKVEQNYVEAINCQDEEGNTPLHIIMKNFNSESEKSQKISMQLIKNGASLKILNRQNNSPLIQAMLYQQSEALRFAIDFNRRHMQFHFNINEKGSRLGYTPLHFAVHQNNIQMICMILEYNRQFKNIDLEQTDNDGKIPIDHCNTISAIYKTLRRALLRQQNHNIQQRSLKLQKSNYINSCSSKSTMQHNYLNVRKIRELKKQTDLKSEQQKQLNPIKLGIPTGDMDVSQIQEETIIFKDQQNISKKIDKKEDFIILKQLNKVIQNNSRQNFMNQKIQSYNNKVSNKQRISQQNMKHMNHISQLNIDHVQEFDRPKLARTKSNLVQVKQINVDYQLEGIKSINELANEKKHFQTIQKQKTQNIQKTKDLKIDYKSSSEQESEYCVSQSLSPAVPIVNGNISINNRKIQKLFEDQSFKKCQTKNSIIHSDDANIQEITSQESQSPQISEDSFEFDINHQNSHLLIDFQQLQSKINLYDNNTQIINKIVKLHISNSQDEILNHLNNIKKVKQIQKSILGQTESQSESSLGNIEDLHIENELKVQDYIDFQDIKQSLIRNKSNVLQSSQSFVSCYEGAQESLEERNPKYIVHKLQIPQFLQKNKAFQQYLHKNYGKKETKSENKKFQGKKILEIDLRSDESMVQDENEIVNHPLESVRGYTVKQVQQQNLKTFQSNNLQKSNQDLQTSRLSSKSYRQFYYENQKYQ